jgi:hypothetical protein
MVTIRLTGDELALKQAVKELERTLGHRIYLNGPHILSGDEWVYSGTIAINQQLPEQPERNGEPAHSDEPVFVRNERVRVRSTGNIGTVVEFQPTTFLSQNNRIQWRYIVAFADGRRRSYLADALERFTIEPVSQP